LSLGARGGGTADGGKGLGSHCFVGSGTGCSRKLHTCQGNIARAAQQGPSERVLWGCCDFTHVYTMDAVFDTAEDVPEEVRVFTLDT
jgi:hypothetical protein